MIGLRAPLIRVILLGIGPIRGWTDRLMTTEWNDGQNGTKLHSFV